MIRRNEILTVKARVGGVCVSTDARARSDGSLGEVIQVESLQDRKSYYARVSGSREAEVYSPTVRTRHASRSPAFGRQAFGRQAFGRQASGRWATTSGGYSQIQLNQPLSAQNNKLQRLQKVTWK